MTIKLADFRDLMRPGLNSIIFSEDFHGAQWQEIYKTSKSSMSEEFDLEMRGVGTASIINEGAAFPVDTMAQRYKNCYRMIKLGNSFSITKEAIDDNQYKRQFQDDAEALKASLKDAKNQLGANVLNNAFNAAFAYGDGEALCSATHPIDGGSYSNLLVAGGVATIDFGEAALEAMILLTKKTRSQSGIRVALNIDKLIVHADETFAASRLLGSAFRTETANNDISAIYKENFIPNGFKVNDFLTTSGAYFLLTTIKKGMRHFQRQVVETDAYADFDTKSVKFSAMERFAFGNSDPRAIFGSPGA